MADLVGEPKSIDFDGFKNVLILFCYKTLRSPGGGCVKRFLPLTAAEFSLDGDLFFMISRSEIIKNKSPSKYYLARSAKKNLFSQPHNKKPNHLIFR